MRQKRGQGLSLNVIIIAVIVLIVLAVVIAIFGSKIGLFSREASACEQKGGVCKPSCDSATETILTGFECGAKEECCLKILRLEDDKK